MKTFRISVLLALCAAIIVVSATPLQASAWNKKTVLTFDHPVRLPGKVTLPAGTYVFKLVDSNSDRNIVQVSNVRGDKTYATILAINDYRPTASTKAVMTFGETASCQPRTIKAWYYAGDTSGSRFVYSKEEAAALAKGCKEPVPQVEPTVLAMVKAEPVASRIATAPVLVATPEEVVVEYAEVEFEVSDVDDQSGYDAVAEPVMPKTASQLPLFGLLGLILLGLAAGSHLVLRRVNR